MDKYNEKLATQSFVTTKVNELIDGAPEALDTLNELAEALKDNENFASNVATQLSQKLNISDAIGQKGEGKNAEVFNYPFTNIASGDGAHAEGYSTKATKSSTHAEGDHTEANGYYSHSEGLYTIANGQSQHVQGRANKALGDDYLHIVGNGEVKIENNKTIVTRSNAHTLDKDGNAWFAGNVIVGKDNKKLLTEDYKPIQQIDDPGQIVEPGIYSLNLSLGSGIPYSALIIYSRRDDEIPEGRIYTHSVIALGYSIYKATAIGTAKFPPRDQWQIIDLNKYNILTSPNGSEFKLKVDNDGNLSTEKI